MLKTANEPGVITLDELDRLTRAYPARYSRAMGNRLDADEARRDLNRLDADAAETAAYLKREQQQREAAREPTMRPTPVPSRLTAWRAAGVSESEIDARLDREIDDRQTDIAAANLRTEYAAQPACIRRHCSEENYVRAGLGIRAERAK